MDGAFFGSIIFEVIGAFFRWLYLRIVSKIKCTKAVSIKQVWEGKKSSSLQDNVEYGFSNIILGVIIVLTICVVIIWSGF